jgi:hypothetical protein
MRAPCDFYTYAYLRTDGTPYYIGKGRGDRAFNVYSHRKNGVHVPLDRSRILFLKTGLTDEESLRHEIYLVFVLGRKDLGNGILRNRTHGGDGASGAIRTEEHKERVRGQNNGNSRTNRAKRGVKKLRTINDGEKHRRIPVDNPLPPGWHEGVTQEYKDSIKKSHHNVSGENNPAYGKRRITNGSQERRIPKTDPIPEGWWEGGKKRDRTP